MTFLQVSLKIFKSNFRRYFLFFLCEVYAVMVFFVYSTAYTNKQLMKSSSLVETMFIAPNLGIILFTCFLMIYSNNSFLKFRKREFGLFMVLGMLKKDIRKIVIIENSLITSISLVVGTMAGCIFSRVFYFLILKIASIQGIHFRVSFESFKLTILFSLALLLVVTSSSILSTHKFTIVNLLKEYRKMDKNLFTKPIFGVIGILMVIGSILDVRLNMTADSSNVLIRSSVICLLGIYLFISNTPLYISKILNSAGDKYKNLLFLSNLKYSFGRSKNVIFIIALLTSVTIFFINLCFAILSDCERIAVKNNPYHIAYAEVGGKNMVSDEKLNEMVNKSDTKIVLKKDLEYIQQPSMIIISDKFLNAVTGSNYHINKGQYLTLFQEVLDDNHPHREKNIPIRSIDIGKKVYENGGQETKVLFNNVNLLIVGGRQYAIFNHSDYMQIKSFLGSNSMGHLKLINFKDWHKTSEFYNLLSAGFNTLNMDVERKIYGDKITPEISKYEELLNLPAARIIDYNRNFQSTSVTLFLYSFVGLLFFISSPIMLHFRFLSEFEREKIKYKKLFKIGILKKEISNLISKELKVFFFLPIILGMIIAIFFIYALPAITGNKTMFLRYSLYLGVGYLFLQMVCYVCYKTYYLKRLMLSIQH